MNDEPRIMVLGSGYPISSLIEDIRASLSDRVIIDARSSDLLKNEADLRLLQYYASDEGKTITIVSRDPVVCALASQLDIEVLSELPAPDSEASEADAVPGGEPTEETESANAVDPSSTGSEATPGATGAARWPSKRLERRHGLDTRAMTRIAILAAAVFLVAVAGLICVRSSRLQVKVIPAMTEISQTVIVGTHGNGAGTGALGLSIPSKILSTEVEYETEIPTTGELREGITPAIGEVLLINSGSAPVRIPAKTKLRTADGIEFEIINDTLVDPKTVIMRAGRKVGETSGTVLAAATACEPGSAGNVPALSIVSIDQPYSQTIEVTNENEFRGGRDRVIRVVSESDVAELRRMSEQWIRDEGVSRLRKQTGLDVYLLLPTLEMSVRSSRVYPEVGRESDRVSIEAVGRVQIESVRFEDLSAAISSKLSDVMGDGFALIADSLTIDSLSCSRLSSGAVAISVDVTAAFEAEIDPKLLAEALAGEDVEAARTRLLESGRISDLVVQDGTKSFPRWSQLIQVVVSESLSAEVSQEASVSGV
jgi:hypothetical protein